MSSPAARKQGKYATKIGGKHDAPSVTTIVGMLDKPGLSWGAAKETALFANHHQDEWLHLDEIAAYERLRKHHKGVWDDKALRGTMVHDFAEQWAAGKEVDCPIECVGYLDALAAFYADHEPEWLQVERTVIYDEQPGLEYAGTFDGIAKLKDGTTALIDLKSGKRYPVETTLQLAAYRYATHMGIYDDMGTLVDSEPLPIIDRSCVLYLHDDGAYELLELEADYPTFQIFLALRQVWNWKRIAEAWEKANKEQLTYAKKADVA